MSAKKAPCGARVNLVLALALSAVPALWAGVWWACDHTVVGELALRAFATVAQA